MLNPAQFYQASWLSFVEAISNLIDEDSAFVFDALDEKSQNGEANSEEGNAPSKGHDINYRDEPVAFFFVLFGITFEALASRPSQTSALSHKRTLDLLQVLRKILRPSVAGLAIYQDATFSEALDLFGRLALTETVEIQATVVQIAQDLCNSHPAARRSSSDTPEAKLSDDIDQLFELTRLIVLVIAKYIPNLADASIQGKVDHTEIVSVQPLTWHNSSNRILTSSCATNKTWFDCTCVGISGFSIRNSIGSPCLRVPHFHHYSSHGTLPRIAVTTDSADSSYLRLRPIRSINETLTSDAITSSHGTIQIPLYPEVRPAAGKRGGGAM